MTRILNTSQFVSEGFKETALAKCDKRKPDEIAEEILTNINKDARRNSGKSVLVYEFEYGNAGYGIRPFGNGWEDRQRRGECFVTYTLEAAGCRYELRDDYTIDLIVKALSKLAEGNGNMCVMKRQFGYYGSERITEIVVVNRVERSFTALQKYLRKYAGFDLTETMCYSADTSGKRGTYQEDVSSRHYFCTDEKRCADFLEKLRAAKSSKDTITVEPFKESDESDREHSQYYETECYGSVLKTIRATVETPSGRVKASILFL